MTKLAADDVPESAAILRCWGRIHKRLLARDSYDWALRKIIDLEAATGVRYPPTMRVDQLLRTYFYGDVIHFGEGRDDLDALGSDAFSDASNRMALYRGAAGLATYHMGYATLLEHMHGPALGIV